MKNEENLEQEIEQPTEKQTNKVDDSFREQFIRLSADFENYKKRVSKERSSWELDAKKSVIEDLLKIISTVDLAYQELQKAPAELKNWLVGIEIIYKNFNTFLQQQGVQEVPSLNFDPELHEALNQVPATADKPSGSIVMVYEKGYTLNGSLIKPAKVSVAE